MKPIEIRLVGRFRFSTRHPATHQHLLYRGTHSQTQESLFMKGEEYRTKHDQGFLSILQEGKVLQLMQGGTGIPHMHWCGQEEDYNFIVLEELDNSLHHWLKLCGGKFSYKTVLMLGQDIVSILQYFHFKNFIHNQINPSNLMFGTGEHQGRMYITDFGGSSRYKDAQTMEHIEDSKCADLRRINMQYSSLRYQKGMSVSRKDDLESMLYLMLKMLKGELPWTQACHNKKSEGERMRVVMKMKEELKPQQIFEGYPELAMLFQYTRKLAFDEKPRYIYYKNVMIQKLEQMGLIDDRIFDWMLLPEPQFTEDPEVAFDVVPQEAEFIRHIREELKLKQDMESKREAERKAAGSTTGVKSPKAADKKECEIY